MNLSPERLPRNVTTPTLGREHQVVKAHLFPQYPQGHQFQEDASQQSHHVEAEW